MKVIISEKAYQESKDYFLEKGFDLLEFKAQGKPYEAVSHHPDMFLYYDGLLFVEPSLDIEGIKGEAIGEKYPETIKYNIAVTPEYVICKSDSMSETIKAYYQSGDKQIIHVNQGYAKCATAVIGSGIMTADKGIYDTVKGYMPALLIEAGHILLPGFEYGFIGGACTCFDQTVFFNGDITRHPDYRKIKEFINGLGYYIDYIEQPLMDIGSMIIIERSEL